MSELNLHSQNSLPLFEVIVILPYKHHSSEHARNIQTKILQSQEVSGAVQFLELIRGELVQNWVHFGINAVTKVVTADWRRLRNVVITDLDDL